MNLEQLSVYVKNGLIEFNEHDSLDLRIYNYTQECQYNQAWDEITLSCRGLIINSKNKIIARPFKKFFNYEEIVNKNIIPNESYVAYEKMDGSLGIMFYYGNDWHIATRGSFNSDQALFAKNVILKKYTEKLSQLDKKNTYLFEIIYPENRIVVDYKGESEIYLLGVIDTQSGYEYDINSFNHIFKVVKQYKNVNLCSLPDNTSGLNNEGYVIKFKSGFRVSKTIENYDFYL